MIVNINEFLSYNGIGVVGGEFLFSAQSMDAPRFVLLADLSISKYDRLFNENEFRVATDRDYLPPGETVGIAHRDIQTISEYFQTSDIAEIPRSALTNSTRLSHRDIVSLDGVKRSRHTDDDTQGIRQLGIVRLDEYIGSNPQATDDYRLNEYSDISNLKLRDITDIPSGIGSQYNTIGGPFSIPEPDRIEGDIYKVFGVVRQLGEIPSIPTNVMIVNRTGGALSTVTVSPDPQGRFVKYYKDLPVGTTFMIVGLWDAHSVPYYEPVVIDRLVASKL